MELISTDLKSYPILELADEGNQTCVDWAAGIRTALLTNRHLVGDVVLPGGGDCDCDVSALEARVAVLEAAEAANPVYVRPTGGDDTSMLLDLVADLEAGDGTGVLRMDGRFQTSETLLISDCHVDAASAVLESTANVGIQIGTPDVSCDNKQLALPHVYDKDPAGNPEAVGIKVVACDKSVLTVRATRHHTPLLLAAEGQGVADCTFMVGELTGIRCLVIAPVNDGWVNQNTFIGGAYKGFSAAHERGIDIRHSGLYPPNNNTFVNPNLEGSPVYNLETAGSFSAFITPHLEGGTKRIRFHGDARENLIVGGYDLRGLTVEEDVNYFHQGTNQVVGLQPEWIRG